jgi:hypothetical protein
MDGGRSEGMIPYQKAKPGRTTARRPRKETVGNERNGLPEGERRRARIVPGETLLSRRAADFEELFRELVEEAGRALEEGDPAWCAILQGYLIPKIEAEGLRTRACGRGAWIPKAALRSRRRPRSLGTIGGSRGPGP